MGWPQLLRHELLLLWRQWRLDGWASGRGWIGLVPLVILLLHLMMWPLALILPESAPRGPKSELVLALTSAAVFTLLLAAALARAVDALFIRADLDLLFSAPVAARTVLLVRTLVIAAATTAAGAVYLVPLANMAMLLGRYWLWTLYLLVPLGGLLAAASGMVLALLLVHWMGATRARTAVQALGVVLGACALLAWSLGPAQLATVDGAGLPAALDALRVLAAPLLASPVALVATLALASALCAIAWQRLDRTFLRASGETTRQPRRAQRAASRRARPPASLAWALCLKEWRCIRRDPLLLSRLLTFFVYFLPALLILFRDSGGAGPARTALVAAIATFGAALLTQPLSQLALDMDESPELLYASPPSLQALLYGKLLAAALPGAVVGIALLLAGAALAAPRVLVTAPLPPLAALACAVMAAASTRIVRRDLFGKQASRDVGLGLMQVLVGALLAGAAALLMTRWWQAGLLLPPLAVWLALNETWHLRRLKVPDLWRRPVL